MASISTGFIGIGSQGGPMAERMLGAGFALTIWARRPEAAAEFADRGAATVAAVEDLGAVCDHIGLCVVNDADVIEVCARLIPAMKPGSLLAVHSTILPETVAQLERDCAARGVRLLDAPVSGGEPGARAGTMTVMCGGSQEAFDQARPVFESFGKLIVLLGEAGAGQRAKIVNNALLAAHMGLAQAATACAGELGIGREAFAELIKASSGNSFGFEVHSRLPQPQAFAHGGKLLDKDTDLLAAILPDSEAAGLIETTAKTFLDACLRG